MNIEKMYKIQCDHDWDDGEFDKWGPVIVYNCHTCEARSIANAGRADDSDSIIEDEQEICRECKETDCDCYMCILCNNVDDVEENFCPQCNCATCGLVKTDCKCEDEEE